MPRRRQSFDPFTPTKVFIALMLATLFFFIPLVLPGDEQPGSFVETYPALNPLPSSADACPFHCVACLTWDPDAWPHDCATWYCDEACENGDPGGGGGGPLPPAITANLNCSAPGANNWCIGALSLDLTASDPQGQSVIISGDVNGNNFTCAENPCSIPLPEGTGAINYRADSATGLSANGSTTYQLDATTPQINGNISGSLGNGGWYVTQTVISAFADDSLSGLASFEMNADNTGWIPYSDTTFSDGIHSIQFRATDNAGNFTETAVQTVMVDTVPPTLNAPTALNVRETLHYELTDAMSGLSQFTIVVADKDNLQPSNEGVLALTGNAAGGDFRWYATFGDAVANTGWHPLTMTVTDAAGNQTTVSGSIEVKHNDLLYMGLVQPHNSPAQSNPSGGGASGATAGGMPIPGIAEAPIIVPPAPVVEPAPAGTENPTPAAETPAQTDNPLAGMRAQFGSSNFTAGNQSATTPTANPSILWGAAASAMLGATVAEWQRKRDEEKARLAASRGGGGDGGTDEGGQDDVQEKRRAQKLAKVNPGLARQQAREKAVRAEIAKVAAKEQKAWERERVAKIEATEAYKDSEEKGQYLKQELNRIRAQEKAYRDALKEAQAAQEREEYLNWLRTGQNPPEGCEDITSASERLALYMQTSEYKAGQARLAEQEEQAEREREAYLHWLRTGQNPPEGYDEAASASERLALYKETPEYQAEQARLAEWQRIADEQARAEAYRIYREGERVSVAQEGGGKPLAMPAREDGPPPLVIINVLPDWLRIVTTAINDSIIQPIKEWGNKLSWLFHNAYGQDLVTISEADSPETALWKTYIIAAINVQREGLNPGGYNTSGKGPAQLSREQLNADYGEPYGCKKIPGENKTECRGYGLGLKGKSPYDPNVAVDGMTNRIEQVLNFAENQSEKNDVILDETDRFIIIALSQNGPGFDKNDISILFEGYIDDGKIEWGKYFKYKHTDWAEKSWLKRAHLEVWQLYKTGEWGKDFDTEFSLELYYQEMRALESQGYPFPDGLDIQKIEDLMNTSEQAKQEEK